MTVEHLATELGIWNDFCVRIKAFAGPGAERLLAQLADLPVKRSHATRRLGSYVTRNGRPVCIRLQFAQEMNNFEQTFRHEIAHACDHLSRPPGELRRTTHGPHWKAWAEALGTSGDSCGRSEALHRLYQQRSKLVAVCSKCGAEFRRTKRLNRNRRYLHNDCGGYLRKL